jgi:hypothetical protein
MALCFGCVCAACCVQSSPVPCARLALCPPVPCACLPSLLPLFPFPPLLLSLCPWGLSACQGRNRHRHRQAEAEAEGRTGRRGGQERRSACSGGKGQSSGHAPELMLAILRIRQRTEHSRHPARQWASDACKRRGVRSASRATDCTDAFLIILWPFYCSASSQFSPPSFPVGGLPYIPHVAAPRTSPANEQHLNALHSAGGRDIEDERRFHMVDTGARGANAECNV